MLSKKSDIASELYLNKLRGEFNAHFLRTQNNLLSINRLILFNSIFKLIQFIKVPRNFKSIAGLLAIFLPFYAYAATPFEVDGKFSVGNDGSANFSIPIVVPPGTAGMQPNLAFSYSSNRGNGIAGLGWGVNGLSQISRCGTTMDQDGISGGVTYTGADRFCVDGQRLIATTDTYNTGTKFHETNASYGANATEYRTENATFAKIISYGIAGTGPAYFKVWTKSGQIIEYGNTADSAIEAQGKPTIHTWAVNKISDTSGNYITVSYLENNNDGEVYVQRIDYTGNANSSPVLAPYASVQFIYETRPDVITVYQAGSMLKTSKRLINIQAYNGSSLVKNYILSYEAVQSTPVSINRSKVKTITECDGNTTIPVCKLAINISWNEIYANFIYPSSNSDFKIPALIDGYKTSNSTAHYMQVADFNGDGIPDYMWIPSNGDGRWLIAYSTATGFTTPSYASPALAMLPGGYRTYHPTAQYMEFADFNGDGKTDYMWIPGNGDGRWLVSYSTGTGFTTPSYAAPALPALVDGYKTSHSTAQYMQFGDFNGDGKTDYMWIPGNGDGRWLISYSTGTGFTTPSYASPTLPALIGGYRSYPSTAHYMQVADFNGDGTPDYMWIPSNGDGRWLIAYSTATGFTTPSYASPALAMLPGGYRTYHPTAQYMEFADFNGDGKTDYMWIPDNGDGRWLISYSTGTGFTTPSYAAPALPALVDGYKTSHSTAQYMQFGDFNGDGLPDYMWIPGNGDGRWLISYSTGTGFTTPSYAAPALPALINGNKTSHPTAHYMQFIDLNGDGLTDYMWRPQTTQDTGPWLIAYSTGSGFTTPNTTNPVFAAASYFGGTFNPSSQYMRFADFNGDGLTDYMWMPSNGDGRWFMVQSLGFDSRLLSMTGSDNRKIVTLKYDSLTNPLIYTKDSDAAYPVKDIQYPIYVVSATALPNGTPGFPNGDGLGETTTNYQYGGLKEHLRGRGSLGFRYVKEISPDSGISLTTFYRQDYPFTGLPSQVEKRRVSDNALLSVVQNTYVNSNLVSATMISKFPYLSQSISQTYELDGSLVGTTTTTNQYDDFGNVTSVEVSDGLGNVKTTTSVYRNDIASWLLGRLIRSTVTSVTP